MISIFTPSHNAGWLNDCYKSLLNQTHKEWEWVVLLNESAEWFCEDSRVLILKTNTTGIGALKREAVSLCVGDILVELDHDDILMPTALEEILEAFQDPLVVFTYSDFAQINEDGSPNFDKFDESYGWTYRLENGYNVCESMEPSPNNISFIWYAPNHVRAFRKEAYEDAGGYNADLEVLDDQDLMSRLYSQGKFCHIPKNLYLQRIHPNNTQKKEGTNEFIQAETVRMHGRTIQPIILSWCEKNGLLALDFGGAHNPAPGYLTVDLHNANIVGDIFEVLANMKDNSVGVIRAVDFLEHIPDKVRLWNEMYRVLAHGGMVLSLTPSTDGRGAFQDPTHNSFYNQNTFWYFADENYRRFVPELKMDFQVSILMTYFPSEWHQENNISYVNANLVAIKEGPRQGGRLGI
jgi:O-antigen biosynthesis protein